MTLYNRPMDHINLQVPNLEDGVEFYTNVLGCKVLNRFQGSREFVFLSDGTTTYEMVENAQLETTVVDHIAYVSDDIQKDYDQFAKEKLTTTEIGFADFLFENGVYYFFIKGPANQRIEFCQRKEATT